MSCHLRHVRHYTWPPVILDVGRYRSSALLQAGLSALKTPQSYRSKASKEDPLHHYVSGLSMPCLHENAA